MSRTMMILVAGLAAGFAQAGPEGTKSDHKGHAHAEKGAEKQAEYKSLTELFADEKKPELWIGAKAPALSLAHFSRGESITSFEPGRTYVVEFWATWCGPCIAAFPHVSDLQKKYEDQLSVIGVNVWERADSPEARTELVDEFVAEHTEMKYTVAIEEGSSMADNWLKPAGQNGIPAAFIVDGQGKVAWIGHPMSMDEPLAQVIAGDYDIEAEAANLWTSQLAMTGYMEMRRAVGTGEWDRSLEVATALVHDAFGEEPQGLNAVAWTMLNGEDRPAAATKLAYKAAKMACETTEWNEWMILDTYALAAFHSGKKDEAIKWQTKAIEMAPEEAKKDMTAQLNMFNGEG